MDIQPLKWTPQTAEAINELMKPLDAGRSQRGSDGRFKPRKAA